MSSDKPAQTASATPAASSGPPAISQAGRTRLQKLYDHAGKLMQQEKYDVEYANTMLMDCVASDPANLVYLERYLENLVRKHGKKRKAGFLGFGGSSNAVPAKLKKPLANQLWMDALRLGLEALGANLHDLGVLRGLAQACEGMHLNEAELRFLKAALDSNPKDLEVNKHCARSLARMGQYDQAIACWHRVEEIKKDDPEPKRMISELTLAKSRPKVLEEEELSPAERQRVASIQAKSTSGKPAPAPAAASPAAPRREVELTPRQRLERTIQDDPTSLPNYYQLADLFADELRFSEAEQVLNRALAISGAAISVREKLEDVQLRRGQHQVAVAEKRAAAQRTPENLDLVRKLAADLNRQELDVYQARAARYPDDKKWQYELGLRLSRADNHLEAARCLEKAREAPDLAAAAEYRLGECWQHLKQFPRALECYERAAKAAAADPNRRKKALYRAGVLAMALKEVERAISHFEQLAAIDAAFQDVAGRLDKLRQMRNKG